MENNQSQNERRLSYQTVSRQLVNSSLRESKSFRTLFPDAEVDKRGRIIKPAQFIVAVKDEQSPDKYAEGNQLWLKPETGASDRIPVRILKSRKCCPNGKRYVLLETINGSSIAYFEDQETITIYGDTDSVNAIGVIHPGGSNSSGDVHSGQTNTYGVNLLLELKKGRVPAPADEIKDLNEIATYEQNNKLRGPIVAVLDSGVYFTSRPVVRTEADCANSDYFGWDFVNNDPFPVDDHLGLHGTKISSIIKKNAPDARILHVKVSDKNGAVTLYDALCGLEYARCRGAKIINASWSFTGGTDVEFAREADREADFPLLFGAIQELSEAGIMVVAAAGNRIQYAHPDGRIRVPKIYPACYSNGSYKVITVTTVTQGNIPVRPKGTLTHQFAAYENFSPEFVDTGVLTNVKTLMPSGFMPGKFAIPGFKNSYEGTSFAAPFITAKLANQPAQTAYQATAVALQNVAGFVANEADLAYAIRNGGNYVTI